MASSSRSNYVTMPSRKLPSAVTRMPTLVDPPDEDLHSVDSEQLVPPSLAPVIVPILRVANEVQSENPKVAYLCRHHAFEIAHKLDPTSSGRGVSQYKTYFMNRLDEEKADTWPGTDNQFADELRKIYQKYYEENIIGENGKKPEEMAKIYEVATILFEVLKALEPSEIDAKTLSYSQRVSMEKEQYVHYNILPLYSAEVKPAIMVIPEIQSAFQAIRNINELPNPRSSQAHGSDKAESSDTTGKRINDVLEWLSHVFGFQEGNVANQREHLILLLANAEARSNCTGQLSEKTLKDAIFKNYRSWCNYLRIPHNVKLRTNPDFQMELVYIALYLLIWGESSNVRFMPECICYIFHMMAAEVYAILDPKIQHVTGAEYRTSFEAKHWFLNDVITPIFEGLHREAKRNKGGKACHAEWRNYDDLNEYFWSKKCLNLKWPPIKEPDFFTKLHQWNGTTVSEKRMPKTNFVEIRTFWHIFRSFDRMWIFFILTLQAMVILAWSPSGSITALFDEDVFRNVLSIFITSAFLSALRAVLDILLSFHAWGNLAFTQIIRYLLKLAVAVFWAVLLPISYSSSVVNPTGLLKLFSSLGRNWHKQNFYYYCIAIYLIPNIIEVLLFFFPTLRKFLESSNARIIVLFMWWDQPKLYIGRGMHDGMFTLLRYTVFWVILIVGKLAFSYYVEILPLVGPTKSIVSIKSIQYEWHEFFPNVPYNIGVVISIWSPIILVYFMDTQIWYSIYSTLFGGILGAFMHLGEIRTLGMLRARFKDVPSAFNKRLVPCHHKEASLNQLGESHGQNDIVNFSHVWNEFIYSMRMEDLISNRERDLLLVPSFGDVSVLQYPPFLLASKIPMALDMAKDFKGTDEDLFQKISADCYTRSAVIECYETLRNILLGLLKDKNEKEIVRGICDKVIESISKKMEDGNKRKFLETFQIGALPHLNEKLQKFLKILLADYNKNDDAQRKLHLINMLQDIMEIIIKDIMVDGTREQRETMESSIHRQKFGTIDIELTKNKTWREKVVRLYLLLSVKESSINVPMNFEARRRMTFFTNSLFMSMPSAPKVRDMLSFSVLTPYFKEDVLYSVEELTKDNDDGISVLFYLKRIYPDEWTNFQERAKDEGIVVEDMDERDLRCRDDKKKTLNPPPPAFTRAQTLSKTDDEDKDERKRNLIRHWASNRGQTLSRTVRGMMYYRQALELQSTLELREKFEFGGKNNGDLEENEMEMEEAARALVDMKFTYVVSCQIYGQQKVSNDPRERACYQNILDLMIMNPSLRIAYIDSREEEVHEKNKEGKIEKKNKKVYYSVLIKGRAKLDEEIYRIKLPGPPTEIGEGKPENQNHAIIFTRGEALQTIDMNQDNYLEEAFKVRNLLEELVKPHHGRTPTILGLREHIFTGSVSSLAWFMSNQETSFVTIGQRVLANPLRVRFHYGHPDVFDRIFHITRGGISKASKTINLSEDIFSGYNTTLRGGFVTHNEYIQVGKGRDVGMNQISLFEAKVASGNGEQTLSRDVYRLGRQFDFYRMLSFYFTTVGFYFSSMVTVLTVYVFLYGRIYLNMSGLARAILEDPTVHQSKALEQALASQSVFQLGILLVLPMVMESALEKGFRSAVADLLIMQLQLAPVFFTFHLGSKAHYYGRTILHGGSKYRATGRGFVVFHARFAENYRQYSRSHFVKGLELLVLLLIYQVYGNAYRSSSLYFFVTFSIWFVVVSWLFAPFVFNPSGFEWQKTVDDWSDWINWMGNSGGIGVPADRSWDAWWDEEQEHLRHTTVWGRAVELLLAVRFLIFQYGIVYHLDIAHGSKSFLVYGLSWVVMLVALLVMKMMSMGRRGFRSDFQLMFRILKMLLFLGFVVVMAVMLLVCGLTARDVFAAVLAFMPTGWAILLAAQALKPVVGLAWFWDSIKELGRSYEYFMGLIIFVPIAALSWFPIVSEFQTRLLFNQAFSRGLQISMILAGRKDRH